MRLESFGAAVDLADTSAGVLLKDRRAELIRAALVIPPGLYDADAGLMLPAGRDALLVACMTSPIATALRRACGSDVLIGCWHRVDEVRPQRPGSHALPWHQDGAWFSDLMARAWLLLDPTECGYGTEAPGVQFLPGEGMLPKAEDFATVYPHCQTHPAVVARMLDLHDPWRPMVRRGDALLFMGDALHATYWPHDATRARWALELTVVGKTDAALAAVDHDFWWHDPADGLYVPTQAVELQWRAGARWSAAEALAKPEGFRRLA